MKDHAGIACLGWVRNFIGSRAGSIAPLFAVAVIPLTIAVGAATDIGRQIDIRSQMQDIADSAALAGATKLTYSDSTAGVTMAQSFLTAAFKNLPGAPTVQATTGCSAPTAAGVNVIVASICVPAYVTSGTSVTAKIQVMLAGAVPTTFSSLVVPSMPVNVQATAQGNVGRQATFSINKFNSSAYDLDQIYYYVLPPTLSTTTGEALYTYTPTLTSYNLILSNAPGFVNQAITIPIGYGDVIDFAMSNTTGGRISYASNCYGQTPSSGAKIYYSHRTTQPTTSTTQYYDYAAAGFHACTPGQAVPTSVSPDSYYSLYPCGQGSGFCYPVKNGITYQAYGGNNIYTWGYSLNPLQYGVLNRDGNGIPTGGTTTSTNSDCTKGDVTYNWDDNGGQNSDDNDFNDIVFTVNCQATLVQQSTIKLVN